MALLGFSLLICRAESLHSPPQGPCIGKDKALVSGEESDTVPVPLQYWDEVAKIEKQRSKHLTKQPYMVFSRFQHLLFLEGCFPIWLRYLQVSCAVLNLGHFFPFLWWGSS